MVVLFFFFSVMFLLHEFVYGLCHDYIGCKDLSNSNVLISATINSRFFLKVTTTIHNDSQNPDSKNNQILKFFWKKTPSSTEERSQTKPETNPGNQPLTPDLEHHRTNPSRRPRTPDLRQQQDSRRPRTDQVQATAATKERRPRGVWSGSGVFDFWAWATALIHKVIKLKQMRDCCCMNSKLCHGHTYI